MYILDRTLGSVYFVNRYTDWIHINKQTIIYTILIIIYDTHLYINIYVPIVGNRKNVDIIK